MAAGKGHEDDLVAAVRAPVPRAVLADEHALRKGRWQRGATRPGQAQRRGVRAERVVGHARLFHKLRPRRLNALVHMLAEPAVRPAVEGTVLHRGQVVGHQVAAQLIALVHHRPQRAGARHPCHAVGVAQAAGVRPHGLAGQVELPDGRAAFFSRHAALGHVAVGAHRDIELPRVGAEHEVLGPVVVDGAGRQIGHLHTRRCHVVGAGGVGKAQHGVGVGHVQHAVGIGHAEGRVQAVLGTFEQHAALVGPTLPRAVAQQGDAVGAGRACASARHHQAHHPAANAAGVVGLGRRVGLGHQHVAVGQHEQPARVVEPLREGLHLHAGAGLRHHARRPAHGRGDVDGGNQRGPRLGQGRHRSGAGRHLQRCHFTATRQSQRQQQSRGGKLQRRPIKSSTITMVSTKPTPPTGA